MGLARSSSEERRKDPNQDRTFLVEVVKPRGKYGKAYGKCFFNGKPDDSYRKECYPEINDEEIPCAGCGEWVIIDVPGVAQENIYPLHKANEIMPFGKHKGKTLAEIYQVDSSYLSWLEENHDSFKIDFAELKLLYPTIKLSQELSIKERTIEFGKYKGLRFIDIAHDISYLEWLISVGKLSKEDYTELLGL